MIYAELWGGLQTNEFKQYLLAHGVEIHGKRTNDVHLTQREYRDRGCSEAQIDAAIDMILAVDGTVSQRSVESALDSMQVTGAYSGEREQ